MYRSLLLSSLALVAALALAEVSSADTFCVTPEGSCPPAKTYTSIPLAIDAAVGNGTADTIRLGASIYTAPTTDGFHYDVSDPSEAIEFAGQGFNTVLTAPAGTKVVLNLDTTAAGSAVHDLRVHIPASVPDSSYGIKSSGFDIGHVTVDADANQTKIFRGAYLLSGTLHDSTVAIDDTYAGFNTGVVLDAPAKLTDSKVTGVQGVESDGATVERDRVTARGEGIHALNASVVRNCLIRLIPSADPQYGLDVWDAPHTQVANLTLIGTFADDGVGIVASATNSPTSDLDVANVLMYGFETTLVHSASGGQTSNITVHHSDVYDGSAKGFGLGSIFEGPGVVSYSDPGFVDLGNDDYRLAASSPLIDHGDPSAAFGSTDLLGNQRVFDGDGNGSAVPDIGAYEYGAPAGGSGGGGNGGAGGGGGSGGGGDSSTPSDDVTADLAGNAPSSNDARSPASASPAPSSSADRRAPVITRLRVSARWLRLRIDEAALVDVRVYKRTKTGLYLVRRLRVTATTAGKLRIALGRLHHKRYRVVIAATDAAGNHSAPIARRLVRP